MTTPLLPLVDRSSASDAQADLLDRLPPNALARLLAHAPELAAAVTGLGIAIMDADATGLTPDVREVVVLRTAIRRGTPYVEHQHRALARAIGVTDEELAAVATGRFDELPPAWAALLRIVDRAVSARAAEPEDVAVAVDAFGPRGVVGALVTSGFSTALGSVASALALPPEGGADRGSDAPAGP